MSFKISLKDTSFHISINSLGLYLSPECLLFFLSNYSTMCGKYVKFMEFAFLENRLIWNIFNHTPPHSILVPIFSSSGLGSRKLLILPSSILSKICFPQQQKGMEETTINLRFIKIQSENIKMTWNIRFFIFCMLYSFVNNIYHIVWY